MSALAEGAGGVEGASGKPAGIRNGISGQEVGLAAPSASALLPPSRGLGRGNPFECPLQGSPAAPYSGSERIQVSRSPETPARGADRPVFPSFGGANKVGTDSGHNP